MFCKNCGTQIADGEKFCRNCGTPVEKISAEQKDAEKTEQPISAVQEEALTDKTVEQKSDTEEKLSLKKESEAEEKVEDKTTAPTPILCKNCGQPLAEGMKFCKGCGTPVETVPTVEENVPISASKFCKGCGQPIAEGMKFCKSCGKPVEAVPTALENVPISAPKLCKECGQPLAEGMKFCKNCGKPVENVAPASANEPTTVIPPVNAQPTVNQSTVPTQTYSTPYATTPQQPKPPRKPLPKKALIGIIAGGVALVAIIVAIVIFVNIANDPVNKMMGYIDSGSTTDAKQLYASSFRYNGDNLARLEAEVIKKVEEIENQYADGILTEEDAYSKLNVICELSTYVIYKHGYEGKDYIESLKDSEEYYEKANGYKNEGDYLRAARYYGYVAENTPKYGVAQAAIAECLNAYVQKSLDSAAEYAKSGNYNDAISTLESAIYYLDSDKYADAIAKLNKQIEDYNTERTNAFEDAMKSKVESEGYLAAIDDIYDVAWDIGVSLDTDTYNTMVEQYKKAYMDEALNEAKTLADNGDCSAAATVLKRADEAYHYEFWSHLDALTEKANEYAEKVFSFNNLSDLLTKSTGLDLPNRNDSGIANYAFKGVDGLEQYMYTGFSATYRNAEVVLNLGKGYTSLSGIASFEEGNEADDITITFVGDGKNLKSITLSKDHATEDFKIDLTGVNSLSISVKKTSSSSYADAYIALVNTVVTKAEAENDPPVEESGEVSENTENSDTENSNTENSENSEESKSEE